MTNPTLSISTTEQIGRLYQLPGGAYPKKINRHQALSGLLSGELFPSITNIIGVFNKDLEGYATHMMGVALEAGKPRYEAAKEYIIFRNEAAERGSRVHKAIEDIIDLGYTKRGYYGMMMSQGKWKTNPSYLALVENDPVTHDLKYFEGFLAFVKAFEPEFIQQEATVYGRTLYGKPYAGTTDFIAMINGKKYVGDWKCTSALHGTVALQMAAAVYATKFYDDSKEGLNDWESDFDGGLGVQLRKDGSFSVMEADVQQGWVEFSALREVWQHYAFKGEKLLKNFSG